jgi:hypothetical protein
MNKLKLAPCLLFVVALSTRVMADDACQAAVNRAKASLTSADDISSSDKTAKCKAYMRAWLVSMDSLSVCKNAANNDADAQAVVARMQPLMEQLAQGEQTYCAH